MFFRSAATFSARVIVVHAPGQNWSSACRSTWHRPRRAKRAQCSAWLRTLAATGGCVAPARALDVIGEREPRETSERETAYDMIKRPPERRLMIPGEPVRCISNADRAMH